MSRKASERGVTLIELVITVLVAAILLAIAIPSFNRLFEKSRLKGAAERLSSEIQYARAEALERRAPVSIAIKAGQDWCIGLTDDTSGTCDCSTVNDCQVGGATRITDGGDFKGVGVQGSNVNDTFEPLRGVPDAATYDEDEWPVFFKLAGGRSVGVELTVLGSVRLCSPAGSGNLWDYPTCAP